MKKNNLPWGEWTLLPACISVMMKMKYNVFFTLHLTILIISPFRNSTNSSSVCL